METRGRCIQSLVNCQRKGAVDVGHLQPPPASRTVRVSGFEITFSSQVWGAINPGVLHFPDQGVILWTRLCSLDCLAQWLKDWDCRSLWLTWFLCLTLQSHEFIAFWSIPMPLAWNRFLFFVGLSDLLYMVLAGRREGDVTLNVDVREERRRRLSGTRKLGWKDFQFGGSHYFWL